MNKLAQFFQEDNGTFSATRLAFLAWIFGVLIMWGISSFQDPNRKLQEIPQSVQVLIGILMTGKVVQKFREQQTETQFAEETIAVNGKLLNTKAASVTKALANPES